MGGGRYSRCGEESYLLELNAISTLFCFDFQGTWIQELYSEGETVTLDFSVKRANVYYIVFKNTNDVFESIVHYNLTLEKTEYSLVNKVPLCEIFQPKCVIDLGEKVPV